MAISGGEILFTWGDHLLAGILDPFAHYGGWVLDFSPRKGWVAVWGGSYLVGVGSVIFLRFFSRSKFTSVKWQRYYSSVTFLDKTSRNLNNFSFSRINNFNDILNFIIYAHV